MTNRWHGRAANLAVCVALVASFLVVPSAREESHAVGANMPAITSGASQSDSYAQAVLADHPISYWRLNELSGTIAHDQTGNTNGTISGGVTLGQPGAVPSGNSMRFNGVNGLIAADGNAGLQPPRWSIEAWFQSTSEPTPPSGGHIYIFHPYGGNVSVGSDGTIPATFWGGGPVPTRYDVASPTGHSYLDGRWHYVVVTRDTTSFILYVDGGQVASLRVPDTGTYYCCEHTVGIGDDATAPGHPFSGLLAEVAVYSHALTAAQVRAHYQAAQRGNSLTACTLSDLNWSAWCSVSASEGLVLHDVTLGPRYLAQEMSVGYLNVVFQPAGGDLVTRHIALAPHATERAADGSFIAMSVLTQPPTIALMPGPCGYQLCKPDYKCPNGWCSPAKVVLKADYRIYLDEQQSTWLDVEQRYQFYQEFNEETNKNYVPCEPGEVVRGVARSVFNKRLLACARFRPIVSYSFNSTSGATLFSVNVAQRLHFLPDGHRVQAAGLYHDCDPKETHAPNGEECQRLWPAQGSDSPGIAGYPHDLHAISHEVLVSAVVAGGKSSYDNLHLTTKSGVELPLPPPGCAECVHMHWRWGHGATMDQGWQCTAGSPPLPFCVPIGNGTDLAHVFGDNQPLLGDGQAWPTARLSSNQNVDVAFVSNHLGEDTPTDIRTLIQGLQQAPSGDSSGTESLTDPVLWVSSTGYEEKRDVFFAFGGFFCSTCGPNNLHQIDGGGALCRAHDASAFPNAEYWQQDIFTYPDATHQLHQWLGFCLQPIPYIGGANLYRVAYQFGQDSTVHDGNGGLPLPMLTLHARAWECGPLTYDHTARAANASSLDFWSPVMNWGTTCGSAIPQADESATWSNNPAWSVGRYQNVNGFPN